MSKMKEIAALLGVEIGEEFEINGYHGSRFRIADEKMEIKSDTDQGLRWTEVAGDSLYELLTGRRKIIKETRKPKNGEKYWCATYFGASPCEWQGGMSDLAYYAIGNCFKTETEAEANSKEVMARLEKIYADGKPLIQRTEVTK